MDYQNIKSTIKKQGMNCEIAKAIVRPDFNLGKIYWLERPPEFFKNPRKSCSWNSRFSGKEAFTTIGNHGYFSGSFFGKDYLLHRIIWLLKYGAFPENQIDHINHDRKDNRIENLREASNRENGLNQSLSSNNTSGVNGVYFNNPCKKWHARIKVDGKNKNLGLFLTLDEAKAARCAADKKYGFHQNHGI